MSQETRPAQMPFSEEEWEQTLAAVQEFLLSQIMQVQKLEVETTDLRERVNRNSHNSSRPPSSDGPDVPPKTSGGIKSNRKRGGQPGHKGTTRKLAPIEQVKESDDIKPEVCGQCGHDLEGKDPDPYRHQVTEIPPVVAEVVEYRLHTLSCPECGRDTCADIPLGVPKGTFGPRLQAMVSLLSGRYRRSKRNTAEIMDDFFQASISLGSVSTQERRTSEAISVPATEARDYVKEQSVVHMDETSWYKSDEKAWLWVAATCLVTVFLVRDSRGGKVAKEMLGETFKGILNSDRWSAYNWRPVSLRQLCWSHLQRDFQTFVERGGESQRIGQAILAQSDLMFKWWHQVGEGTMTTDTFQEKMKPVQQMVGEWLRQGTSCSHAKTAGSCRHILKREAALWTFIHIPGVDPTNNLVERQVRHGVLWRKVSYGTQSDAGSRFAERIMTFVATLRQQKRNVLDHLVEACHAANCDKSAPSLLPKSHTP